MVITYLGLDNGVIKEEKTKAVKFDTCKYTPSDLITNNDVDISSLYF